jgi:hypothetical protein
MIADATDQIPLDWSADGRFIVWDENYVEIHAMDLHEDGARTAVVSAGAQGASLSPDSRWMAYGNEVSGRSEVLVRRFPDGQRDYRVSVEGGAYPRWGRDGREILYRRGDAVLSASVRESNGELIVERPRVLFRSKQLLETNRHNWGYDATTDSLIMILRGEHEIRRDGFVVVLDALAEDRDG